MLQIKITSLTNQTNPSSLQGSYPFHWRGSELFLIRLGTWHNMVSELSKLLWILWRPCFPQHCHLYTRFSLQPLTRCIHSPELEGWKQSKAERGSHMLPWADLCRGMNISQRANPLMLLIASLSLPFKAFKVFVSPFLPSAAHKLEGFCSIWTLSRAGPHPLQTCSEAVVQAVLAANGNSCEDSCQACSWNEKTVENETVVFYLRGWTCARDESETSPISEEQQEYEREAEDHNLYPQLLWLCQKVDILNIPVSHRPFRVRDIFPRWRVRPNAMQGERDRETSRTSRVKMWIKLNFSAIPFLLANFYSFFLLHLRNVLHAPALGKTCWGPDPAPLMEHS